MQRSAKVSLISTSSSTCCTSQTTTSKNNDNLQLIGATAAYPLGIYSLKVKDVKDIPAGFTVAVPNDETNQARALGVLKQAGLISFKNGWTAFSTPVSNLYELENKVLEETPGNVVFFPSWGAICVFYGPSEPAGWCTHFATIHADKLEEFKNIADEVWHHQGGHVTTRFVEVEEAE